MKINAKINKRVNGSVADCRKVLVDATIQLMKQIGVKPGQDMTFNKVLIMHHFKGGNSGSWLADRIAYMDGCDGNDQFFITSLADDYFASSLFISIDNLQIIYDKVRRVVREY